MCVCWGCVWTFLDRNLIARTSGGFLPLAEGGRGGSTTCGDAGGVWPGLGKAGGKGSELGWWVDFSPLWSPVLFAKSLGMALTAPVLWQYTNHIVL